MPRIDIAKASQMGYTPEQVQQYASQKGITVYDSRGTQTPQAQSQGGGLSSLLPLIGAIGGSLIPGVGPIVGPAIGALAGTGTKQLIQGKGDVGELAKETALGGFGGVIGKAASPLFGGLSKLIGRGAVGAGENLATRTIRPSPSQYTGFLEKTGTTIGKFASKKGLVGKPAEQIRDNVIKPLQQTFDDMATNSKLTVSSDQLFTNFNKRIQQLRQSLAAGDQAKADRLEKTMMDIINKYKGQPIPAKEITAQRRNFDDYVKTFNDPIEADINDEVRRLLQGSLQEAADTAGLAGPAGQTLKQMGAELQDLYEFGKIAAKQEGLGKGTLPFGITRLGGAITGGAVGGSYGPEQGMGDNIRNALLGMGLVSAANNPRIISALAKGLIGGGEKLQAGGRLSGAIPQAMGQLGARGATGGLVSEAQTAEGIQPEGERMRGTTPQQPNLTDILKMAALADLGKGGKNISEIIALSNFLNPPTSASTKTQLQQIEGAQSLINQLESRFNQAIQTGEFGGFGKGPLSTITGRISGGRISQNALLYDNDREGFTALIARATGERGVLTDADAARAKKLLPTANMSPETATKQFNEIRQIFADAQARIGGTGQWNIPMPANIGL